MWMADVRRACHSWSLEHQAKWIETMSPDVGDAPWQPVTQYQNAGVYTRYLAAVKPLGFQGLAPGGVKAWIRMLEAAGVCTRTIAGYLWSLHKVATVIFDQRLDWLYATCLRIDKIAERTAKKNKAVAMAVDILQFGLTTIAQAQEMGPSTWAATQLFRDGLILVFGICGPEKLGLWPASALMIWARTSNWSITPPKPSRPRSQVSG